MITQVCKTIERVTTDLKPGVRPSTAMAHGGNSQEGDKQGGFRRQGIWAEAEGLGRQRWPLIERANRDDGQNNKDLQIARENASSVRHSVVQSSSHSVSCQAGEALLCMSSTWHIMQPTCSCRTKISPHLVSRGLAMPACLPVSMHSEKKKREKRENWIGQDSRLGPSRGSHPQGQVHRWRKRGDGRPVDRFFSMLRPLGINRENGDRRVKVLLPTPHAV